MAEDRAGYETTPGKLPRRAKRMSAEPFTSSSRYFRGRVVETLRGLAPGESLPLAALGPSVKADYAPDDLPWLRGVVAGLVRDGLARLFPADEGGSADGERVALP